MDDQTKLLQGTPGVWGLWIARVILVGWAAFWVWFNVASGVGEQHSGGWPSFFGHLAMAGLVIAVTALAWRQPFWGGVVLLVVAAVFAWRFHNPAWLGVQWMVPIALLGPMIVAAALLFVGGLDKAH